jgi:hypothetical protein
MEFDTLDRRPGIAVFDPVENARFELYTDRPVAPEPTATDGFHFPVDAAVTFETTALEIPNHRSVVVRTQDGDISVDATAFDDRSLPVDDYLLELQSTPMKIYVAVRAELELNHDERSVTIRFDGPRRPRVGTRSFHDRPTGTITVTDDVGDAMAAVSLLGSALKTTSCERSFPTLRGHPPLLERGESFDAPDGVERPDTGIELVLPREREYVYPAASLAYYLGAAVVPGDDPRLVADGFEPSLDGPDGYASTVNRTLRQAFFLDCLTRTEGCYDVDLYEREQVEPLVDLSFPDLYGRPLAAQLDAYFSVPFETLEPYVPDWHLTTDVVPTAENLLPLPYVVDELSLLRTPRTTDAASVEPTPESFDAFTRTPGTAVVVDGDFTRSASDEWDWADDEMFQVDAADTVEHAWVGSGYPVGANKVTLESLRRRVDHAPPDDSALTVHVVCNDSAMADENVVGELYGLRDLVTFDVSIHERTTADELATLFETSADFLHYIGHVDDEGFLCADGYLDARSLDDVNVDAFLLNACRSYQQGEMLVEKGSRGGVVTLAEVVNSSATKIGRALARLLSCGFSLRTALGLAKEGVLVSVEYVTVGDGRLTLCQSESGVPTMFEIRREEDRYLLEHHTFTTANYGMGSMMSSILEDSSTRYLVSSSRPTFEMSAEEIDDALDLELHPVKMDGRLRWSDD